jgi:hypothetical protein
MIKLSNELIQRTNFPGDVQNMICKHMQIIQPAMRDTFAHQVISLISDWSASVHNINMAALEFELAAIIDGICGPRPLVCATRVRGSSDLDLSDSFNDLESTYFDPPTWRR